MISRKNVYYITILLIFSAIIFLYLRGTIDLNNIIKSFDDFSHTETFQKYGMLYTFIYSMTPNSIPIPNEVFYTSIINGAIDKTQTSIRILLLITLGGFIGDSAVYFGAKHGYRFFTKHKKEMLKEEHIFNKIGKGYFLVSNIGSLVIPIMNDAGLFLAGTLHLRYRSIAPYILAGNLIRNLVGFFFLLQTGLISA